MSKIFSYYEKKNNTTGIQHSWYDSSNIKYSKCIDEEGKLKILDVVFSNGTQYRYKDVNVNDVLLFENDSSQGKALNRLIKDKKYKYEKLENANLEEINDELFFRSGNGYYLINNDGFFEIKNNKNETVYKLVNGLDDKHFKIICDILKSLGISIKEEK